MHSIVIINMSKIFACMAGCVTQHLTLSQLKYIFTRIVILFPILQLYFKLIEKRDPFIETLFISVHSNGDAI